MSQKSREPEAGDVVQSSQEVSESESRDPPARYQPITQDDNEDEVEGADNARRNRPPAISTSTGASRFVKPNGFKLTCDSRFHVFRKECPEHHIGVAAYTNSRL